MAFVKIISPAPDMSPEPEAAYTAQLTSPDAGTRRRAARALGGDPGAVNALAECLAIEAEPSVRSAVFGSLVAIGGPRVASLVAGYVRSDDAALRGGAIDALKHLHEAAIAAVDALLNESDTDLRLLAIEITRAWPVERAAPRLQRIFEHEPHVNVCAAAVDVATEAGSPELLPALATLRRRFPEDMFLLFAVDIACARIGNPAETDA